MTGPPPDERTRRDVVIMPSRLLSDRTAARVPALSHQSLVDRVRWGRTDSSRSDPGRHDEPAGGRPRPAAPSYLRERNRRTAHGNRAVGPGGRFPQLEVHVDARGSSASGCRRSVWGRVARPSSILDFLVDMTGRRSRGTGAAAAGAPSGPIWGAPSGRPTARPSSCQRGFSLRRPASISSGWTSLMKYSNASGYSWKVSARPSIPRSE
jgi:hypothetical protein